MARNPLKIINPILGTLFLVQASTGLLHSVIPHEVFEPIHTYVGLALVIFTVGHVYHNWGWIRANLLKRS